MTEVWKTIPGWENYAVSNLGRVKRLSTPERILRKVPVLSGNAATNYKPYQVSLSDGISRCESFKVCYLVLITFVGPRPSGMLVRHLDDNLENDNLNNLCWGTSKENAEDRVRNGKSTPGERNGNSYLKEKDVKQIRGAYKAGCSCKNISDETGFPYQTVYAVIKNKTWKHVGV